MNITYIRDLLARRREVKKHIAYNDAAGSRFWLNDRDVTKEWRDREIGIVRMYNALIKKLRSHDA